MGQQSIQSGSAGQNSTYSSNIVRFYKQDYVVRRSHRGCVRHRWRPGGHTGMLVICSENKGAVQLISCAESNYTADQLLCFRTCKKHFLITKKGIFTLEVIQVC